MTHRATGETGARAPLGLPISALAVMLGIVLAANSTRYGIAGIAGGLFLVVAGFVIGARCFRPDRGTGVSSSPAQGSSEEPRAGRPNRNSEDTI